MSSTLPLEPLPLARWLSRPVLVSAAALAAAVAVAWAWLAAHPMGIETMPGMPGMAMAPEPWSPGYLAATFAMWALMMLAMMLPAAAPMVLLHARLDRGAPAQRARDHVLFVASYLAVWAAFSAAATIAQATLVDAGLLPPMSLVLENRLLGALMLAVAAMWQLTAAKTACLDKCRSPIAFVMRYWRPGAAGALRLGLRHGLYCLGCCWSLMLLLFVGGVMNLAWVALLGALVFAEKLAPPRWRVDRWLAGALGLAAIGLLAAS